jgi:phage-related protein (TIGR01555 family)
LSKKKRSKVQDVKPKASTPAAKIKVSPMQLFSVEQKAAKNSLERAATVDGYDNFLSRIGLRNDNTLSAGTYTFDLVTRNRIKLEAAYRGSWVVGVAVDAIAEDMTRAGIDISTNDADDDIEEIDNAISRLQIWQSLCSLAKWGRLYGGAIGVIQIAGQDMKTPLDLETVAKDQFKGIVVFDRWQLNPILNDVIDSGPEMGLPKFYQIVSSPTQVEPNQKANSDSVVTVHFSRVIRYTGIDLPFFQAITEMMWGESVLERPWDRLISFDNSTLSSASLIDRANLRTVGIDGLREIIGAGGEAQKGLEAHFEMMRLMQVNEGLTLLDKLDEFQSTAYSFAGLSDMMLQFGQQLAGAFGIPLVRFFGQSPAGLSATGENDMRLYYDNILAQQKAKFQNPWEVLLKVLWRSTFGASAPKDLKFNFTPLWQMSATDKATNAKTTTETIIGAYEAGLTSRRASLEELRASSGDTGIFSNITDEEINEADLEQDEPPLPDGDPNAPDPMTEPSDKPVKSLGGDAKPTFLNRLRGNA